MIKFTIMTVRGECNIYEYEEYPASRERALNDSLFFKLHAMLHNFYKVQSESRKISSLNEHCHRPGICRLAPSSPSSVIIFFFFPPTIQLTIRQQMKIQEQKIDRASWRSRQLPSVCCSNKVKSNCTRTFKLFINDTFST